MEWIYKNVTITFNNSIRLYVFNIDGVTHMVETRYVAENRIDNILLSKKIQELYNKALERDKEGILARLGNQTKTY